MSKSTFFTGQPIFNQVLSLIPRSVVKQLAREHNADRYCKSFRSFDHLVTMLYSTLHKCNSIREVITGMQASASRLRHLGILSTPRRSTLSDANERRSSVLFEQLYHRVYNHYYSSLPDSPLSKKVFNRLFIIDSTVVTLFSNVMRGTGCEKGNGRRKGGIKAHVMMQASEDIPCFVRLTEAKVSDATFLRQIKLPKGSIIVMDKGYRNFRQFLSWSKNQVTWVTRLHGRTAYKIIEERPLESEQTLYGIQQDFIIDMGSKQLNYINPVQKARLVVFYDKDKQRHIHFITNNFTLSASTIAEIYKKRWQIELLFKRMKQNFQLHYFLGDNENAIRIQLWCTLIADLLLKIIKDQADKKRKWSMANLAGLIKLHLGTYIKLSAFLANPEKALINYQDPTISNQLLLFNYSARGA